MFITVTLNKKSDCFLQNQLYILIAKIIAHAEGFVMGCFFFFWFGVLIIGYNFGIK